MASRSFKFANPNSIRTIKSPDGDDSRVVYVCENEWKAVQFATYLTAFDPNVKFMYACYDGYMNAIEVL